MQTDSDILFPSSTTRVLSAVIHFVGVSILAHCLSRRLAVEKLSSLSGLAQLSLARSLILLTLLDSWLFLITGGIVIFGAGLESSSESCSLGIYLCIVFYATSKALIYFFLVEKMHIVWAPLVGSRRLKSPVYLFASGILLGYLVIMGLLFIGRISHFRDDGSCVIGLKHLASIPLIVYDLLTNLILTTLFLYPLWRSNHLNARVKRIAARTTLAALVALATSTINILILTLMHGEQLGWVCLGACGSDVVVNAIALFWVTTGADSDTTHSHPVVNPQYNDGKSAAVILPTPINTSPRNTLGLLTSEIDIAITQYTDDKIVSLAEKSRRSQVVSPPVRSHHSTVRELSSVAAGTPENPETSRSGGISRILSMFRITERERSEHEMEITVTREYNIQTDFNAQEVYTPVPPSIARRGMRRYSDFAVQDTRGRTLENVAIDRV